MDRFSHKAIIISKNLDGFSLANHRRFCQIRQTFLLYGTLQSVCSQHNCVINAYKDIGVETRSQWLRPGDPDVNFNKI